MRALALLVLASAPACDSNFFVKGDQIPDGLVCGTDGSCPPGQGCVPGENLCRRTCTTVGALSNCPGGNNCQCSNSNSSIEEACDYDHFCRPACGMGGGMGGMSPMCGGNSMTASCPSGQVCDSSVAGNAGICRTLCSGTTGTTACLPGFTCTMLPMTGGCGGCVPGASFSDGGAPTQACEGVVVSTLAGNGTRGFVDGTGGPSGTTQFSLPTSVAVDNAGNVYVADTGNDRIRKVAPDGTAATLAGNGVQGFVDGTGGPSGTTEFGGPNGGPGGVAVDGAGIVYVADSSNNRIRKVAPDGTTTTLAGNGVQGFVDGTGGPSGTTEFKLGTFGGVAVDNAGNVYVADAGNNRIRKVAPDGTTTTLAGNGVQGFVDGTGGPTGTTKFKLDVFGGVAVDGAGNVYVADTGNNRIRKVAPDGTTTTLAGNGKTGFVDGTGGPTGTTEFGIPTGVAIDGSGNVYVTDGARVRRVAPDGTTTTISGATPGFLDGPGCSASFDVSYGVAVLTKQLFISDGGNNRIRLIQLP